MDVWDLLRSVRNRYLSMARRAPAGILARADRRDHPRWDVNHLPATLYVGEDSFSGAVENISLTGACIQNAPPFIAVGDTLVLATTLQSYGSFVVACDVVRVRREPAATELGVRFMAMEQEDTNALFFFLYELWQQTRGREDAPESVGADSW